MIIPIITFIGIYTRFRKLGGQSLLDKAGLEFILKFIIPMWAFFIFILIIWTLKKIKREYEIQKKLNNE